MQISQFVPHCTKDFSFKKMVDDSRQVNAGDVFVFDARLCAGAEKFIADARAKGAVAIITNAEIAGEDIIAHQAPNAVLAQWAKTQYSNQPETLVAVTGTNGKTSVAWFFAQIMNFCGLKAGSVGTLGIFAGDKKVMETGFTAPTPLKFHESLALLAKNGVKYACVEASSHALTLNRLDGVKFQAAALTNITQDHLDFHKTMEAYAQAKFRLFEDLLGEDGTAVLNVQRIESLPLLALCKDRGQKVLTCGSANAELVLNVQAETAEGMQCTLKFNTLETAVAIPLLGRFQAQNVATALGLALASGAPLEKAIQALPTLQAAPGRMELYGGNGKPVAVVDYAHTEDALRTALSALRPLTKGQLKVVFGCGGDRDSTKRPLMGKAAAELADAVIITDDNPRTEDAAKIRAQIKAAAPSALDIGNRAEAITTAIQNSNVGDVILVAGKGHESGQIIGKETLPFDDREQVRNAIQNL